MENNFEIKYVSPRESIEKDGSTERRIDLIVNGEKVGAATLDYLSKPIRLYQVSDLYVDFEQKGKGYASAIMEKVEEFLLRDVKLPGVLVDAIFEGDSASGMYERRGWISVPNSHGLYVFNWPEDVSLDVLQGFAFRYTDPLERESNK